jgi:hypothetical protein
MRLRLISLILTSLTFYSAFGQGLDKLKLMDSEVPEKYKRSDEMLYIQFKRGLFISRQIYMKALSEKLRIRNFNLMKAKMIAERFTIMNLRVILNNKDS